MPTPGFLVPGARDDETCLLASGHRGSLYCTMKARDRRLRVRGREPVPFNYVTAMPSLDLPHAAPSPPRRPPKERRRPPRGPPQAPRGRGPRSHRGGTASASERTLFAKVTKRWQRKDLAAAVSVELKATRKSHGAEVAVRMPLALWATLAPPPR